MLGGMSLFARRIESMENIRSIVTNEVTRYVKRGVNVNVDYVGDKPITQVIGQVPMSGGRVKVIEALYLGSSNDGAEEHPPIMTQYEYDSLRVVGQVMVVNVYEGVLLSREYMVQVGDELRVADEGVRVIIVGKDYAKIKDAVEGVRQQGVQQAKSSPTQQPYYAI